MTDSSNHQEKCDGTELIKRLKDIRGANEAATNIIKKDNNDGAMAETLRQRAHNKIVPGLGDEIKKSRELGRGNWER